MIDNVRWQDPQYVCLPAQQAPNNTSSCSGRAAPTCREHFSAGRSRQPIDHQLVFHIASLERPLQTDRREFEHDTQLASPVTADRKSAAAYVRSIFEREMGVTLNNVKAGSKAGRRDARTYA